MHKCYTKVNQLFLPNAAVSASLLRGWSCLEYSLLTAAVVSLFIVSVNALSLFVAPPYLVNLCHPVSAVDSRHFKVYPLGCSLCTRKVLCTYPNFRQHLMSDIAY